MSNAATKTKRAKQEKDPVRFYAEEALSGGIVAGPHVRLACQRHLEDLTEGKKEGLRFDLDLCHAVFDFWQQLSLPEGKPFIPLLWQKFCVGNMLAWLGPDGYRRYRTAYIETGKGSGKSPLAGFIANYGLFVDDEPDPKIYVCATKKDQAKICFEDAVNICKNSEILEGRYEPFKNSLHCPENNGLLAPMSADKKQSGFRPHFGIVDELHEHPNDIIVTMLRANFKGRNQPMLIEITNTPQTEKSVCGAHRDYSIKVLNKVYKNDKWFAFVCGLDAEDDWKDEAVWEKANPSLGVVITKEYLRERVVEAEGIKEMEDEVKRLNFCIMTGSRKRSIDLAKWDKNNPTLLCTLEQRRSEYLQWADSLKHRECYGGLDLALVSDLTAYVLFFPPTETEPPAWLSWYWCPAEDIVARSRAGVPYDVWSRLGWIKATEGNETDFSQVQADIIALHGVYQIRQTAYDRTFGTELVQKLTGEGINMLTFGQGFLSMNAPTKTLLRYVKASKLLHGSHPVTRWCAENLVCDTDAAGNMKPDKKKSSEKIDGISAGVMGIGAWLDPKKPDGPSVYEQKGQLLL